MKDGVLKKVGKELRLKKCDVNNKVLFINRKIEAFLKKNGIGQKSGGRRPFLERIYLFRELTNNEPYSLNKYEAYKWILECWLNGSNDIIKKNDPLNFYFSEEWLKLRKRVLKLYGEKCMKCGITENIHVDHIKPRSLYPELELVFENMQVLCKSCNSSKSNRHIIDYRFNIMLN